MNPILRNTLAVIAGLITGSVVNMGLILIGGSAIPPPEGADITTMEGLKASMHLFTPKHFIFPFLAHALGTMAGAFLASRLAAANAMKLALVIGFMFLAGGLINVINLSAPVWYNALDLVAAYLPMAYIGGRAGLSKQKNA